MVLSYLYQKSRLLLVLGAIAGVIGGLSGAAIATVISRSIWGQEQPWMLAAAFFGLCIVAVASKSASEIAVLTLTQRAILSLRIDLSRKLLATPIKKLRELGQHGLTVILTKDIDTFIQAFQLIPLAFGNIILILACLSYLAWLSWPIFVIFAVCLLVGTAAYQWGERYPLAHLAAIREHVNTLHRHFRDLIEGSKELQLNSQRGQRFVDDVIAPTSRDFMFAFRKGMVGYICVTNIGTMQFYLVIGAIIFVAPQLLQESVATITTATLILLYMVQPVSALMASLPTVRQAFISLRKIEQLEGELDLISGRNAPATRFRHSSPFRLEMKGVRHRFASDQDDRHFMLGPIDLAIERGEIVFIVGGNGSGKTTLAMLLLGLYSPESGSIWLDGEEVTDANREHYRNHFSAVFSDFHVFEQLLEVDDGTLGARATRYMETLRISHKVSVKNGNFSTLNLSSGQRKRLALVSSYLEDRALYLFDEWAADQDPEFKRVFYRDLLPDLKRRGKMVFVISHDDAYFDCADRIIKLEDGKLKRLTPRHPAVEAYRQ